MEERFLIPSERIIARIFLIRGKKIIFDRDLARLYGVTTKALNQAVKRNLKRFPEDFMFQLSKGEFKFWKSQIVTSKRDKKGLRKPPFAFTEYGVAMLSGILTSERAITVNIQIVRTFIKIREILASNRNLKLKIEEMERRYDKNFRVIFDTLRKMVQEEEKPRKMMGFCERK